ncbi:MAG TPA: ATP-binding protein [Pyrinomonadaceae bacterium]|nr:ATP-binding protein [Pyrinomonadaceae bacterium]
MSMTPVEDEMARPTDAPGAAPVTPFLDGLPIGVYRTSPGGRVLLANPALLRMLGYASLDELAARDLNREFEPQYPRSEFKQALEQAGEVIGLESLWKRKDGATFYARENARAVRDEDGAVLYFEGTVEDVTGRRRAEEERHALLEIVQGLNTTYDLNELFSLIHRAVGRVLYAENFLIALYNPETGFLHFEFFVDKYDPPPPPRPLGKGLTGYVLHNDTPLLLSEDDQRRMAEEGLVEVFGTFSASWLGVPLRTPSGAIGVLIVQHYEETGVYTGRDVEFLTSVAGQVAVAFERRRAEVALRRSEAELKVFAAKLESSNRELQDFASVASHDLQEPLRKIQAFGDRLKTKYGDALGDGGRDYLERMQNAASRMQTLINDLLTFSRVTTKAQPFVAVDLREVAGGVVSDLEARVERSGGRVEMGEMLTLEADPLQMRQLLQNLIGNALKFHRPGEPPLVRVWCERAASVAGDLCRIHVADNGIGFDEKYLDRIFTVFQRLHGRQAYEGTGVGLAVCRRIAERHGGSITAASQPGRGSTFLVTLPVTQHRGERD